MEIGNADVKRRLVELAFGRANDCVQLVLDPEADAAGLDLSLLTEVRRSERGAVEVKLIDRLEALRMLSELCEADGAAAFLREMEE